MRWGVLGPLLVCNAGGATAPPAGPALRFLLAALLSRANTTVAADTLASDLWGELPPRTAAKTLQSHMVRVRDDLGRDDIAAVLVTETTVYRLNVDPYDVDALRFATLVEAGVRAVAENANAGAVDVFDEALALWRGEAYEE